jgi:hypothetical protein
MREMHGLNLNKIGKRWSKLRMLASAHRARHLDQLLSADEDRIRYHLPAEDVPIFLSKRYQILSDTSSARRRLTLGAGCGPG